MKNTEDIRNFLNAFVDWASTHEDVHAIALVGLCARDAARDDSDIDLVLLNDQPQKYLADLKWIENFGSVEKQHTEDYGKLISIRVWYQDGVEVEYGMTIKHAPYD
jgi:predicted nucleotidyltransferase